MEMPEHIQRIVAQFKAENQKKAQFARLHRRRGIQVEPRQTDSPYNLLDRKEAEEVLEAWYAFHRGVPYRNFREFYSKEFFCRSDTLNALSEEAILDFIADRKFLFLDYNQHMNDGEYPLLHAVCSYPGFYQIDNRNLEEYFEKGLQQSEEDLRPSKKNLSVIDFSKTRAIEILKEAFQEVKNAGTITQETYGEATWKRVDQTRTDRSREDVFTWIGESFSYLFLYCRMCENADLVLRQGLVPTKGHWKAYQEWVENREELQEALARRKEYMRRCSGSSGEGPHLQIEPFVVYIPKERACQNELEEKLSILFYTYLKETVEHAYQTNYSDYVGDDPKAWVREVGSVLEYLTQFRPQEDMALVFYHLFTKNTMRLARHCLHSYKFRQPKDLVQARLPIEKVQGRISHRIICNIKLYDHLLSLFPPEDPHYAKFRFYAFTGYQWYVHFKVPVQKNEKAYQPSFEMAQNLTDGVDKLGYLLKRNISFCLATEFKWLTPDVDNTPGKDAETLVGLMLYEENIKASAFQLTHRIRRFLKRKAGEKLVEEYSDRQWRESDSELVRRLNEVCEKENFYFLRETYPYENGKTGFKKDLKYGRYVLEFQILEQLHDKGRRNLYRIVQKQLQHLFFFEDPFYLKGLSWDE